MALRAQSGAELGDEAGSPLESVVDAIAAALVEAGVQIAFTFPGGGSNLALIDALHRRGVRTVLTRSEIGGGLMAATIADITGTPGVLIVGLGPGAASAMNAVSHAWLDRSPLLLVADRYAEADAHTTGHQLLDQRAMYAPVTKAQVDAAPGDVADEVTRAIAVSLEPPRGPVLIEIRRDRAGQPSRPRSPTPAPSVDGGPSGDVPGAARTLARARRPVLLVGEEARRDLDPSLIVALAESLTAPVLTTYKAKGVFPERHPLAAGILTGAEIERPLLAEADVLLGIGLDPVELLARPWRYAAQFIAVRRRALLERYLRPSHELAGRLDTALERLQSALDTPCSEWVEADIAQRVSTMMQPLQAVGTSLSAWRTVEVAQELAGDAIVTVDAGAHMFAVTWRWRSDRPNRFHMSNGLATMGYAVPAAIGCALACPDELVIAFTGDGGFTINAAELETAARAGARIVVVVLNDARLSLIRVKQDESGLTRSDVDFLRSDFAAIAEGLGVRGVRASTEPELRDALEAAISEPRSTVVDVAIDGTEYAELHRRIRSGS
jgi:acetolactate synthase-1/2/3 large subunit